MLRKIMWELSLEEAATLHGVLIDAEPDPDDDRQSAEEIRELMTRFDEEFPELPYALDPMGFLKEELEQEFMDWANSLPDVRRAGMEIPLPSRDINEYFA